MKEIIYNLSDKRREEIIEEIIEKYTKSSNSTTRNTKWKDRDFVKSVIMDHLKYLTVNRNMNIKNEECIIKEEDSFKYLKLFNSKKRPNINKLKETAQILDSEETIGKENANIILKGFGNITESKKERILLQINIIKKFNYMKMMIENPSKFSIGPKYLYARLAYYNDKYGNISKIPASKVLSDKDDTEGNRKKITERRKEELINKYKLPNFDDDSKGDR